jgi:hypothetical protein
LGFVLLYLGIKALWGNIYLYAFGCFARYYLIFTLSTSAIVGIWYGRPHTLKVVN